MTSIEEWPEPIIRVQSLSDNGLTTIPDRYIKPPSDRPSMTLGNNEFHIPVIDLQGIDGDDNELHARTMNEILTACREWGFFQIINHGVSPELMHGTREVWRDFFHLPIELKQEYANSPNIYEGYGSRLGVQKDVILDWCDYFFLHYLPPSLKDVNKWPIIPSTCREETEEYGKHLVKLCRNLMKILSMNLGQEENQLQKTFGGENIGATFRVNLYPKCPQPKLALGLSSHSDPGGMTLVLPDNKVAGLQVRKGESWVTVQTVPNAFIVNIGDQIEVLSNGIYRSVEHRVLTNSTTERLSLVLFYNPKGDQIIQPLEQLVTHDQPALYQPMTFDEYRLFIRTNGLQGKSQVESMKLKSPLPGCV